MGDRDSAIKVAVRCRIFLPFEIKQGNTESVVDILPNDGIKIQPKQITSLDESRYRFTFDATYGKDSSQADMYNRSIVPLVNSCLEGYNATCLAYGQTGSGKTHTILGQTDQSDHTVPPEEDQSEAGVIPRALRALFRSLAKKKKESTDTEKFDYNVKVEFLELYGEDIRDLLQPDPTNGPKLSIRDGNKGREPEVIGIKSVPVESAEDALLCLTRGTLRRVTRATAMNAESSRSHAIMSVIIEQKTTRKVANPAGGKDVEEVAERNSKFHFVDLAGSERIKRTLATAQGMKEGININKGLLILGNVISTLAASKKGAFVPYRDSKLTRLLKGSLGGNHKTLMIACVSPSGSNTDESLNTLRYANRAKNIQNKAVINMDAGSKMIADLRAQLKAMATELLRVRAMVADGVEIDGPDAVFTEDVLKAISGGGEVKLNIDKPGAKPVIKKAAGESVAATSATSDTASVGTAPTTASTSGKGGSTTSTDPATAEAFRKAREEIKKLKRALEKSDDRVLESNRQLEWMKEELKISKEEVMALGAVDKSSDGDSDSNVSALTEDFEQMPRLSQETYETVKNIYEEKLVQMTFELKEREDERDNIAMTLYRHESDSQRLFYVKNTLTEDLQRKEEQIASLKQELRDMANVTVVSNGTPQAERQFRRLRGRMSKRPPKNANTQMSSYYTEKLNKIDRHIKLREEECHNLGTELQKLEADSAIFTDLAKDLSERLDAKDKEIKEMKDKASQDVAIKKNEEERDQLGSELERLNGDSDTFSALVKALTEERKTKLEHVEKYKKRHREMATSIGLTSPYKETPQSDTGSGEDVDDDASVSSTWSLMSIDTVATNTSTFNAGTTMTKIDYDQKVSQLEANITKYEEDRIFILNDLEKLEGDTHAFTELSNALKQKLRAKEDQINTLKKELADFSKKLDDQAEELETLAKKSNEMNTPRAEKAQSS